MLIAECKRDGIKQQYAALYQALRIMLHETFTRMILHRLMQRSSDHWRRQGGWLSPRDLCKPNERFLPKER